MLAVAPDSEGTMADGESRGRCRVTVLCGGPSSEREVSLQSGAAVAEALRRRHDVTVRDIGPDDLSALDVAADVVFPALHGAFGEDGALQGILEQRGIRFVGSGSAASALAMDKHESKLRVQKMGLPTAEWEVIHPAEQPRLRPPCVVKPVDQGSSVCTFVVRDAADLEPAIARVCGQFGRALVERFVDGDEITVGIVGEPQAGKPAIPRPLPPICIRPKRGFYDYVAKYEDEATEYLFDAGHPAELYAQLARMSLAVFAEFGCRHLARIDWMVDRAARPYFLEVNTLPGFTAHSLVPKAAQRLGVSFEELVDRLVRIAFEE